MPPGTPQAHPSNPLKRPRQDPVSCQFCRSKKLKCNREQPCSNCAARGLPCAGRFQSHGRRDPQTDNPVPASGQESVLARLKRLEDIVLGPSKPELPHESAGNPSPYVAQSKTTSPLAGLSPASEYEEAVHSLEEAGTREKPWISPASSSIEFRITSTRNISHSLHDKDVHAPNPPKCISLPTKEEAAFLLDLYVKYIDDLQHVIYIPTVRKSLEMLYSNLDQALPVMVGEVALLLSIFASTAAFCSHFMGEHEALFSTTDASLASVVWGNAALEVLEFSRRTTTGRLEDVQASVVMGFLLYIVEGFSSRSRIVFASAITISRDLGLHKIDIAANQTPSARAKRNSMETEIKRRLWWHVVATDWLLALSGGPQEGTYLVQPRHMRVNWPRNVDDVDLVHEDPPVDLPLSEPTTMSYYIQRIKLAHICREVVDAMPLSSLDLSTIDYQQVIALDAKFEAFFDGVPDFFKTDESHRIASQSVMRRYPHMRVQRYALGMISHTRRCKLHQPFLIRRSLDGRYDYSREISLKSARNVILMKRLVDKEYGSVLAANLKLTGIVYHIFMAIIVLVMDLCFNKSHGDDNVRKAEVMDAFKILEEAKSQSRMAKEFLDSLMDILRKYKVRLHHPPESLAENASHPCLGPSETQAYQDLGGANGETGMPYSLWPPRDNPQHYLSDFDEIWTEYVELGPNMNMPEWDNLFSDLDSRF